ncbi:DUF4382 domain-containing protein [Salinirubrum litoreum]|uniref:DUF4382 domain-containing protein n=1 Tax=Salinirubrum litoreum TaxID=1126234 RepID=A0ABD5R8Y7_9EURY|nr:DUF4382 domain-containing protein [Salinirubrum litoreum]
MERRNFLEATATLATASTVGLAGCSAMSGTATGTLATRVSDQPGDIADFEECIVTITEVWAKPADGELVEKDVEETDADLTELQGEASSLVDEVELETGEYSFLQVQINETSATLTDGSEANVQVPGEAPLKFEKSFEIRAGETTQFTADFTPVKAGGSGMYNLQPVAEEVTVTYEDEETESGNQTTGGNESA